jgi:hypothetical protein
MKHSFDKMEQFYEAIMASREGQVVLTHFLSIRFLGKSRSVRCLKN